MSHLMALYMGSLILRSIGIAVIAGICSWKLRNVAIRHAVWVVVLVSILLMPAADYLLPATWIPARIQKLAAERPVTFRGVSARAAGAPQPQAPATTPVAVSARSKPVDSWNIASTLYALVAFAMFIRLALGYRKIRRLRRTGRTIASPVWEEVLALHRSRWRIPVLLESEEVQVPLTMGLLCPAVILPADWKDWDEWKMRAVLLHEIAHIRRNDWGIAVIAAAAKCAYWLNPLTWLLERKLSQLAEQACDDASVYRTQNATRYAEILLEFAATTQNGGRLIKGGVAMAQHNMKARIERVLGKPQSGTGFVRIAGWTLVIILSVPVIYSAAALQVASEPRKAPVPTYVAEFVRNPSPQAPAAGPQVVTQPAPVTVSTFQQNSPNPAADPRVPSQQMEIVKQQLQRQYVELQAKLQEVQKGNQTNGVPAPEVPRTSDRSATADFIQEEMYKAQLRMLQTEVAIREAERARIQVQMGNPPSPNQSQLDRLRVNEAMLDRYRAEIDKLNGQVEMKRLASGSIEKAESKFINRIFVTGRVKASGDFESDRRLTVLQALALAGGFQDYARMDAISIIRMDGDSSTLFHFNYSSVIKGINTSQNIYLENGDVVVVP